MEQKINVIKTANKNAYTYLCRLQMLEEFIGVLLRIP